MQIMETSGSCLVLFNRLPKVGGNGVVCRCRCKGDAIREWKKESSMQIQVHSDNHIEGSARLTDWVSANVADKLARYDDELTRVVVHLNDENGAKAGAQDKRCQIEARPKGLQPVSVSHKAETLELAIEGALDKLHHALDHLFGKLRDKRSSHASVVEAEQGPSQDALLREDFLAEEQLRAL